jgi:predicted enzyme related to lactoylglutathione lyase
VSIRSSSPFSKRLPTRQTDCMTADAAAPPDVHLGLVLDARDPEALAPFWAAALRYKVLGGAGNYVMLAPDGKEGPNLLLQRVPEAKAGKNRMHVDVHTPDVQGEAARLEALGARRLEDSPRSEFGTTWVQMADPEGNEFCVCDGGAC